MMKFEIEQILEIKERVYLLTRGLNHNSKFKLSNHSFLNNIEIENSFDVTDIFNGSESQRPNVFGFVLKFKSDKEKIKKGEVLILHNLDVKVIEVFLTISGKLGCVLECGAGMLAVEKVLTNKILFWKVIQNDMRIGRPNDLELQKLVAENMWFQYFIEPINHSTKPEIESKLFITNK